MVYVIGQSSGQIYAQGTKAECMRKLQQKYPTCNAYSRSDGREGTTLPEPMKFLKHILAFEGRDLYHAKIYSTHCRNIG